MCMESWINKVFDLSNFSHISIILSDLLQIYLFNIYMCVCVCVCV